MGSLSIKSQKGAAAVEFALALIFLVPLLAGMIEFGTLFYNKAKITNASREGARLLITYGAGNALNSTQFSELVINRVTAYCGDSGSGNAEYLINPGESGNSTVTVDLSGVPVPYANVKGDPFTVTVQYNYRFMFLAIMANIIPSFTGGITISAQTTMGYEEPDE